MDQTDVEMNSASIGETQQENVATATSSSEQNVATGDAAVSVKTETVSCPMEVDPPIASQELSSTSLLEPKESVDQTANESDSTKYPKVSLRLNEFGIFELMEPSSDQSATGAVVESTKPVETPIAVPAANNSASAASTPGNTTLTDTTNAASKPEVTTPAVNNSMGGSNGDRERWKQRFPSNAMAKVDIVCCKQCDGYGIADEFVDADFCSDKCRKSYTTRPSIGKSGGAGKVATKRKSNASSATPVAAESSVVESTLSESNEQRETAKTAPSATSSSVSSSWSWSKYLERRRAQAAPERLFSDPFPYSKNGFKIGMKLEACDSEHQSLFCVATVAEVLGYRIRLHFDGYSDTYDFWVNADSDSIFPCGWCEKNGQKLRPPKNYELSSSTQPSTSPVPSQTVQGNRTFSWPQYLKFTSSVAAPRHLFVVATQTEYPLPSAFRVRMKLEAVDRRHASHTLCVATVANVIGNRFLVHFDGWDSIYDYWADPSCPYIHPVGWAHEHNTTLTPPCDFDAQEGDFSWDFYLAKTSASAVPPRAFKPRNPVGFKTGMKLECVDPKNPQLIRVATVAAVKGYRLKIHFDGWSNDFDFWTDDDWPDLHPPGWCQKSGHPLQPPLSGSEVKVETDCPTIGCNGIGHVEGARFATHNNVENCPYSHRNVHRESPPFPDRLAGEELETVIRTVSPGSSSTGEGQSVKDEPVRANKIKKSIDKSDVQSGGDSSVPSSPPPPVASKPTVSADTSLVKSEPKDADHRTKSKQVSNNDLPTKTEPEAEFNHRDQDRRAESPSMEQQYDSLDAMTPPPKKMRISYFTGKSAPGDVGQRKSGQEDDRRKHIDSGSNSRNQDEHDTTAAVNCASQARQPVVHDFYPTNANLTTPLCWSKHAALLGDVVSGVATSDVVKWNCEQVVEFLAKFGIINPLLDRIKEEKIDGEALLYLSQSDLTDILGIKLGPAIKIRNALLLIKETANPGPSR